MKIILTFLLVCVGMLCLTLVDVVATETGATPIGIAHRASLASINTPASYCNWVLATPGPWPPCAGGMHSRRIPWVSSTPGCVPETPQPMDLEETEACTDGADTMPQVHLFIHVPMGVRFSTIFLTDTLRGDPLLTPIITLEGVRIYR